MADEEQVGDWFLAFLVKFMNKIPPAGMPITLSVGGTLISGDLVSGESYFKGFADELGNAFEGGLKTPTGKEIATMLRQETAKIGEKYATTEFSERVGYVHLKGARIVQPGAQPLTIAPPLAGWWRIRLESVDGFTFGSISAR